MAVVAVIMIGICMYISVSTAYYNMINSQAHFYEETNFADYYFQVIRAPQQVVGQIEEIAGVNKATGRIQKDVPLLKEDGRRATVRLLSYPLPMENEINRLHLDSGRLFEEYPQNSGVEILTDPQFAEANKLSFNSTINIVAEGKQVPLTVVGTAISAEFIYIMKDAATLLPDPETFGIVMLPRNQAEQILDYSGQVNQIIVRLVPGVDEEKLAEQIEALLEPYGNLGSYPREDQLSHAMLQTEIDGLRTMANFMPAVFLGAAAAIQLVMLRRMVRAQRAEIGVMNALGYGSGQIMWHYTSYALAVAFLGTLLGTGSGIALAAFFSQMFALFFNLPETISSLNLRAVLYGFLISMTVSLIAGLTASRGVAKINPAESMSPEPPKDSGTIFLERWSWLWHRLSSTWKMSLRNIYRKWGRFMVTLIGVAFAVTLLILSMFTGDSVNYMMDQHFNKEQHYDLLVTFSEPIKQNELLNLARWDGVIKTEPVLDVPVEIYWHDCSEKDVLQGLPKELTLKELVGNKEEPLALPEEGILVSRNTAAKLELQVGDAVTIKTLFPIGPARYAEVKIMGINSQLVGSSSYISLEQANRILQETGLASGVMLKIAPGQAELIESKLNEMTNVSSVSSPQKEFDNLNQYLDSMFYMIAVMIIFAVLLGFAIVYNAAVISFAERKKELAFLRALGFSNSEVSGLLLKEILLQSILGVALGLPLGYYMSELYVQAFSTDIFTMPMVFSPPTYLISALGGVVFVAVAYLMVAKGVKRLELVDVLKNKD